MGILYNDYSFRAHCCVIELVIFTGQTVSPLTSGHGLHLIPVTECMLCFFLPTQCDIEVSYGVYLWYGMPFSDNSTRKTPEAVKRKLWWPSHMQWCSWFQIIRNYLWVALMRPEICPNNTFVCLLYSFLQRPFGQCYFHKMKMKIC